MRQLLLLISFFLTSCAYYGDLHSTSKPFNTQTLDIPHVYSIPTEKIMQSAWWNRFHDPQLNQLIALGLQNSPDIKIAMARLNEAAHLRQESTATLWPSIDFNGYVQRQKFSKFGLVPPPFNGKTYNISDLALNFNYELDFFKKNRETVATFVSKECAAAADLAEAELLLSSSIANTYFKLLNALKQRQFAKENLHFTHQIANIVWLRAKKGIVSDIPLQTALNNVEQNKLFIDQYTQAEMLARNELAVLIGDNPFSTEIKTKKYKYHPTQVTLPFPLTANLIAHRPDIAASRQWVEASAHQINVQKARFFPNINISALFSYQSVGMVHLLSSENENNAVTGAIDLPIFDAGARRQSLSAKYAAYDKAVNEYNKNILNALQETADQMAILQSLNSQLKAEMIAVKSTDEHYRLLYSQYNHGIVDYVDLLELKQLLLNQRATLVNLQSHKMEATVALMKALGGV